MAERFPNSSGSNKVPCLFVKPGFSSASTEEVIFYTIVCYGIVITLFDKKKKIGGMCHYLFPKSTKKNSLIFAKPAITSLLNMLKNSQSDITDLEAHIIGGACKPGNLKLIEISDQNIRTGYEILENLSIPIVKLRVGGYHSRKVLFNTHINKIQITQSEPLRSSEWVVMNTAEVHNFEPQRY